MSYALHHSKGILINDYKQIEWRDYMTAEVEDLMNKGSMFITPVNIGQKEIGVITSHIFDKLRLINDAFFSEISFLFDHLNLYLSTIRIKR